jgi:hypothetical protein
LAKASQNPAVIPRREQGKAANGRSESALVSDDAIRQAQTALWTARGR